MASIVADVQFRGLFQAAIKDSYFAAYRQQYEIMAVHGHSEVKTNCVERWKLALKAKERANLSQAWS